MWATVQGRFATALTDQRTAPPYGVRSERFDVHRNNVASGLARALALRFPATERIVGEEFFAAMAREFVSRHPPASPVLLEYGGGFAEFVENFEPASELFYLPDVVRLEDARVRAYHAADARPLSPRDLADVPRERLADLTFDIHPSVSVVRSKHPIVTIWSMNVGETELAPLDDWVGEDALAARPESRVDIRRLPPGGAIFVERLLGGAELGLAAQTAARETRDFDLAVVLAEILAAGVLAAIRD